MYWCHDSRTTYSIPPLRALPLLSALTRCPGTGDVAPGGALVAMLWAGKTMEMTME